MVTQLEGGAAGGRGAPRLPHRGEESRAPGLWDKDPVPLPRGAGRTAPSAWGCAAGPVRPRGFGQSELRGRRWQPGTAPTGEGTRPGTPAAETGWGLGSDPGPGRGKGALTRPAVPAVRRKGEFE